MPETTTKTTDQKRKGRIFKEIMRGLSWSPEVRAQVPEALWAHPDVADGWRSGPLVKSMRGIKDPDLSGVTWTAWAFLANVVMIQSSVMAKNQFVNLREIAADSRANPGDTPTSGL